MKRSPLSLSGRAWSFARSCRVLTGVALLGLASSAPAALFTWTGAGPDGNWQTAANWSTGTVPGNSDTELFNNAVNTTVTFTARTQTAGITWDTGVGSFTYNSSAAGNTINPSSSGGSFNLNAGATNVTETFNADVQLFVARTNPVTITFNNNSATSGYVFNNMYSDVSTVGIAATMAFRGNSTVGATVNGVISDRNGVAGGATIVQKTGGGGNTGTLTLNGANTYTGGTDFSAGSGTIVLGNKSALGTGALRITQGGNLQSNTSLAGANAVTAPISYIGTTGANTTTNAVVTLTAGSNTGTLTSGTAPLVGDLVSQGAGLPAFTVVTAVNGTTITFSTNAVSTTPASVTLTTVPFTSGGTATTNILGANNLEFSGAQFLTSTLSNGTAATQTFNVTNTGRTTFSGVMQEQATILGPAASGSVIKTGTGVLALSAANTYTGTTTVAGGTLLINNTTGSGTGSGAVTVNASNILGGTGTLGGITGATTAVTNNGFIAPGDPLVNGGIGLLTLGSSTVNRSAVFGPNSTFSIQVGAGTSDRLAVFGNIDLSGTTDTLAITGTLDGVTNYVIATYTGAVTGTFNTVTGLTGNYNVQYSGGMIFLAVPEPGSVAMMVAGGLGMLAGMRFFRRRAA